MDKMHDEEFDDMTKIFQKDTLEQNHSRPHDVIVFNRGKPIDTYSFTNYAQAYEKQEELRKYLPLGYSVSIREVSE